MSEKTDLTHVAGATEVKVFHLKYEWEIRNYSLLNLTTGVSLNSATFSPNQDSNIKWYLEIYPEGATEASKDYVSLFLIFSPTESRKEMIAQFEINILEDVRNHRLEKDNTWHVFDKENSHNRWGYTKFIKKDELKNSICLLNDCLTIVCSITGHLNIENLPNRLKNNFINSKKSQNISTQSGYQKLFGNKELTDIILTASDGKVLHAHKAILAAHSPVFLAMFTNNMKETLTGEVNIPDVQFEILQEVLRFIYCGTVQNIETRVHDLLAVSNKYAIESLEFECEKYLVENMKIDTVLEVLSLADIYNAANLRKYAIDFFLQHKKNITGTENLKSFPKLQPHTIEELTRKLIHHS